jgi:hypothetical protein
VNDRTRGTIGLVSPALSDSLEVGIVVRYLLDRRSFNGVAPRLTANASAAMTRRGWQDPAKGIVPTDALIDVVSGDVTDVCTRLGNYPHEYVDIAPVATQSTRLLKVACDTPHHQIVSPRNPTGTYHVRMSQSMFDASAPLCGMCGSRMSLV